MQTRFFLAAVDRDPELGRQARAQYELASSSLADAMRCGSPRVMTYLLDRLVVSEMPIVMSMITCYRTYPRYAKMLAMMQAWYCRTVRHLKKLAKKAHSISMKIK